MFTGQKRLMSKGLCYALAKLDAETLLYALAHRLSVVEEEKVGNTPAKVECKAVVETLAARETEVKVEALGDTLSELTDMVAINEV